MMKGHAKLFWPETIITRLYIGWCFLQSFISPIRQHSSEMSDCPACNFFPLWKRYVVQRLRDGWNEATWKHEILLQIRKKIKGIYATYCTRHVNTVLYQKSVFTSVISASNPKWALNSTASRSLHSSVSKSTAYFSSN